MNVSGIHAVEAALDTELRPGTLLLSRRNNRVEKLRQIAERKGIRVQRVGERELDRLCGHKKHQGAVLQTDSGKVKQPLLKDRLYNLTAGPALILLLDSITDPHNYGAILRSADQFNVDLVLVPERRGSRETETVLRTSAGASAYLSIITVPNINRAIKQCKEAGFWVYGAHMQGEPAHIVDLKGRIALVLGSEGRGLHHLTADHCDSLLSIPAGGHADSFNVSVAAGILLYEIRRQQGFSQI